MPVLHIGDVPLERAHRISTGELLGTVADISKIVGLKNLRFHYEILPPGKRSSPPHRHTEREEIVFVLEGAPTLVEGDEKTVLQVGDMAVFPANENNMHSILNESNAEVRVLVASASCSEDRIIMSETN